MKYLLDTHTLLWHVQKNPLLSQDFVQKIESKSNQILISTASLWEMTIKINIGKLKIGEPLEDFIERIEHSDIEIIPITKSHLLTLETLPIHHRDPFDRLIICQAIVENLGVISKDEAFDNYAVTRLWS